MDKYEKNMVKEAVNLLADVCYDCVYDQGKYNLTDYREARDCVYLLISGCNTYIYRAKWFGKLLIPLVKHWRSIYVDLYEKVDAVISPYDQFIEED